MFHHILPQTINDNTCAARLRQLLKHLMVRRVTAWEVPIGSKRSTERDIPPMVRNVYEEPLTPEEHETYDAYWNK